ncbi:UDP-N-acetylmuramoyl-L-alanine--D-glutamate ligase [Nesterenkonia sp.]|uniref:UDP-N-acetylmuramoyl-L-alanine--D-glutamate ligase n=1 Tax=Nesterenkonia sp. TaxID=704201 RepID=UPI002612B648|nr:UDP-N-acetylmuramoyl-L-alanine--D-glutamate ligase [Nesterenkonia sp.]
MTMTSLPELHGWDGPWAGLRVAVTGLGVTGFSAADTLVELGCRVVVVDGEATEQKQMDAETLRIVGVADIRFGDDAASTLPLIDGKAPELIVTSPGWRPDSALISSAAQASIPVWSDIQLARRLGPRPGARSPEWLTLTGTNGKTTTVTLLEAMLRADGRRAAACGNIGLPILDAIRDPEGFDVLAVELSSFQLHYTEPLGAAAAAVLNIAEDHVDWHGGFEAYAADKARIYEGTRIACVYNAEDPVTEQMVAGADVVEGCRAIGFTTDTPEVSMVGLVDDILVDRAFLAERRHQALELATRADFGPLAPKHLVANALAAAALARAIGVAPESVQRAIAEHQPGEHRIQPVAKADDVLWINDTKATNPHAAAASLASFTQVVWIAGGLPKGVDYEPLVRSVADRLAAVILIGTDSSQLRSSLERHAPAVPVIGSGVQEDETQAESVLRSADGRTAMRAAVAEAARIARPGQTVLLAPAAASMDQFASYADRGEAFIEAVAELMERKGFSTD